MISSTVGFYFKLTAWSWGPFSAGVCEGLGVRDRLAKIKSCLPDE